MDFAKDHLHAHGYGKYQRVDTARLPQLYLAYKTSLGKVSGTVLTPLKTRFAQGDPLTLSTLADIAALPAQGLQALQAADYEKLANLINQNFDLRTKIMDISDSNLALVQTARQLGASASFTGSGGAIIGTLPQALAFAQLKAAMASIGAEAVMVQIAQPAHM